MADINLNQKTTSFPSDWIDPKLKQEKAYNIQYAKAAYDLYNSDNVLIPANRRVDYINNRLYAEGNQDNTKYKKWMSFKDEDGAQKSYVDLDYSPVSPIVKYRNIVLGLLEKQDYEIDLSAIDPASDEERLQIKYNIWAKKKVDEMLVAEGLIADVSGEQEEIMPETKEELEIYMDTIKLSTEMAMSGILDLTFYHNDWTEIRKMIWADLFDNGIAGTREYVTKQGEHKIRYVDPVNLFVRRTRRNDCKGSNAIGEIVEMTLSELYADAGDQLSIKDYKDVVGYSSGKYNNPIAYFSDFIDTDSDEFRMYGQYGFLNQYGENKIKVMDLTWLTVDESFYEQKENVAGDTMTYPKEYGYKAKKYEYFTRDSDSGVEYIKKDDSGKEKKISKDVYYKERNRKSRSSSSAACVMSYGCKWIIGTDCAYDYGKLKDMPREKSNLKETNLPYHIYRLTNKSYIEQTIPFIDGFMLSWMKLQNAKAKARPNGLIIELDALENMSIGGSEFTPLQALAVYDATGNLIYKGTGVNGDPTRHRPVENAIGGMGQIWQELVGDINFNIEMIRSVTGFNEVFDASSPQKGQSVTGSQIALNASANSLEPLISAYKNIFTRTAKSSALRLQMMSKYNKLKGYEYAIGEAPRKIIEITQDLSLMELGIKVQAKPSQDQKAKIESAALTALNTRDESGFGQITYPDYLFIMRILDGGNLRYAEKVLAFRIEKRVKAKMEINQQNSEVNAQIQERSISSKAQVDNEKMDKEHAFKLEEIDRAADAEIRVNEHKYTKQGQAQIATTQIKAGASQSKDQSDIQKKEIESQSKIQVAEMGMVKEKIEEKV